MGRLLVVALSTLLYILTAYSEPEIVIPTEKKYPPYPEVWGYDLSEYQSVLIGRAIINSYNMPNGDVWFTFRMNEQNQYLLLKFFDNEKRTISEKDYNILSNKLDKYQSFTHDFETKNFVGKKYYPGSNMGNQCRGIDLDEYIVSKNKNRDEEKKYSIYAAYPTIRRFKTYGYSEQCPTFLPYTYQQLYSLINNVISLSDDNFISHELKGNVIVRFEISPQLKTKFHPTTIIETDFPQKISHDILILPYEEVQNIKESIAPSQPLAQSLHELLLKKMIELNEIQ